jgi:hypothetical protein
MVRILERTEGSRSSLDIEDERNHMRVALVYVTGLVNQELLPQNEYLAAESRFLKACRQPGWRLSNDDGPHWRKPASVQFAKDCWQSRASPNPMPFLHGRSYFADPGA